MRGRRRDETFFFHERRPFFPALSISSMPARSPETRGSAQTRIHSFDAPISPGRSSKMPTPGSSSRATRAAFETVEHWRIGTASLTGARPAESPVSKSPNKIEREDGSDAPFASEEVEAARIMYDAFRATKGPDGELIDTEEWSAETEARVEVRRPTSAFARHPFPLESGPSPHAQFTPRRANLPLPTPNADADHPATTSPPPRRSPRHTPNRHRRSSPPRAARRPTWTTKPRAARSCFTRSAICTCWRSTASCSC